MPPYLRVVELSAWVNASKDCALLLGGMPMPVSLTAKCRHDRSSPAELPTLDRDDHLALLGELDGVADQVDDDLAQPARIADQRIGHVAAECGRPAPAPSCGPAPPAS